MIKSKSSLLFPIIWLTLSTVLLTLPGSAFPKENWLGKIWFDKWVHIAMFSILTLLWCWSLSKKNILLIAGLCLIYGITMEFIQHFFIPNRSFEWGDIIADAIGCITGALFIARGSKKN